MHLTPGEIQRFQNSELYFNIRALSRCTFYVTNEEDRTIRLLEETYGNAKGQKSKVFVYNVVFGLVPVAQLTSDWTTRSHTTNRETETIHAALTQIYKDDTKDARHIYVITDPDRWFRDETAPRRILNIIHQINSNSGTTKIIIFIGPRKVIPEKLQQYINVVQDPGLSREDVADVVTKCCTMMKTELPANLEAFQGWTSHQILNALCQGVIANKDLKVKQGVPEPAKAVDLTHIKRLKRDNLKQTDLLSYVDTDETTFKDVGGLKRFKVWAQKTRAAWTPEGQKFGLKPPKGILATGIWGSGKSLSVKALGSEWNLPVVQLEMGRLRSSGVGETEANVYRAIRLIDSVSPCLIWVDEAEKSLSGTTSSSASDAGTTARTIGILSTWLQETKSQVCLAMTSNGVKTLPVEFINRMDERFFFGLPDEDERIDILRIHIAKVVQDVGKYQLAELAEAAKNMVGREIEQAIGAAMVESFHQGKAALDQQVLLEELRKKPRIFRTMTDDMNQLLDWVGWDHEVQEGIRARFASDSQYNLKLAQK